MRELQEFTVSRPANLEGVPYRRNLARDLRLDPPVVQLVSLCGHAGEDSFRFHPFLAAKSITLMSSPIPIVNRDRDCGLSRGGQTNERMRVPTGAFYAITSYPWVRRGQFVRLIF